jgi:putative flippase GtrA
MKYKAYSAGCSIKEIPILFPDRKFGKSKMTKRIFLEALINIWKIKRNVGRDSGIDQFVKFAITGGLGTITNLLIFFLCVDKAGLPEIPISIGCFLIAATQNYIINHTWSFKQSTVKAPLSIKKWLLFISASLLGLAVNIVVMKLMLIHWALPYNSSPRGAELRQRWW